MASAFTTPQNSAQKGRFRANETTFQTPKKTTKNIKAKPSSAVSKTQEILLENIQEYVTLESVTYSNRSQNKAIINKPYNYDSESTDDEWERELASTFKPGQRWMDVTRNEIPDQSVHTPGPKVQSNKKVNKTEKTAPKRNGGSVVESIL